MPGLLVQLSRRAGIDAGKIVKAAEAEAGDRRDGAAHVAAASIASRLDAAMGAFETPGQRSQGQKERKKRP